MKRNKHTKSYKKEAEIFKKWCENLPHLKFNADEEWLMVFLHSSKFKLEKAKPKIETFYLMRQAMPEIFTNRDPNLPRIQEIIKKGLIVPINQDDQKTIIYFSFGDPERYPVKLMLKAYFMTFDVLLMDEGTKFLEYDLLIDLKSFSPKYEEGHTPNMLRILLKYFEEGYPLNVMNIHFINPPPYAMPGLNLILMFASQKKRAKIHIHCENDDFEVTKLYPLSGPTFVTDEDGERRVFNDVCAEWKLKMDSYRKWLMYSAFLFTADMRLRLNDGRAFLNPFGLEEAKSVETD